MRKRKFMMNACMHDYAKVHRKYGVIEFVGVEG